MTQNKKPRQLGTLSINVNGKNKSIKTTEFEQYEEGFSFCVDSELDAFQAAYLYQRQSVRVTYAPNVNKWLVQVNKPAKAEGFNAGRQFSSPSEAISLIIAESDPVNALMAVVEKNIKYGEFGFASDVLHEFSMR